MPPQADAAPTNPPKPRGEATNGSPRQHTTNDPTTSTVGTKHGVAVGSGVAAARSPRQEEPREPSPPNELAICRAQLAAAERKIGEQADSLRRREAEVATLREQLQEQQKLARRRQPPPPPAGGGDALGNLMRIQRENEVGTSRTAARSHPIRPHTPPRPPRQALRAKVKELTRMLDEKPRSRGGAGASANGGGSGRCGGGGGSAAAAGRAARPAAAAGWAPGRPAGGAAGGAAARAERPRAARRAGRSRRPSTRSRSRTGTPTSSPSPGYPTRLLDRPRRAAVDALGRPPRLARWWWRRPSTSQGGRRPA